jgi:thiosulfate/3-mercaptopyruvate sulfurtransferase
MLPPETLKLRIEAAGIDINRPIVTSCGSGISACILALGLHLIGARDVSVYDGSWAEWGSRPDTPVVTGAK